MPKPNCMDIQAVTERLQLLSGETAEQLTRWFQSGDDVTAFTAGDVTVQQSGQHKASALMLEDAEQACRGLLRDDAFAFLSV